MTNDTRPVRKDPAWMLARICLVVSVNCFAWAIAFMPKGLPMWLDLATVIALAGAGYVASIWLWVKLR